MVCGGGQNVLGGGASDGGDGHDACGGCDGDDDGGIFWVLRERPWSSGMRWTQRWMWFVVEEEVIVEKERAEQDWLASGW